MRRAGSGRAAHAPGLIAGAAGALAARALLTRLLLLKLNHDVRRLNAGDHAPLLAGYASDAVLRFNEGPHRWSGEHRGREAIARFLRDFVRAGLQGEVRGLWIAGPPWDLRVVVRLDDRASGPNGEQIYANRVAVVLRTRWGKIVEHDDFYVDTERIVALERKLGELGVGPVTPAGSAAER
jgi:ketosteroid isomerase-like protein